MDSAGRYPMDVTRLRSPLPTTFIPELEHDIYADLVTFCFAAIDQCNPEGQRPAVPQTGYPGNVRGASHERISGGPVEEYMWMAVEDGAGVIDAGLIHRAGTTSIAILESVDGIFPVANHIAMNCPTTENNPLLKLSEWFNQDLSYGGASHFSLPETQRNGVLNIVYADGEALKSERGSFKFDKGGNPSDFKRIRTKHPELRSIIGAYLTDLRPVETSLSRVWMKLVHQPFIPFDARARQKLIDGLPAKYREWVGKWQRFLAVENENS
jgi:hypothetical protein